jgi:hypothetical protein
LSGVLENLEEYKESREGYEKSLKIKKHFFGEEHI